MPGALITWGDTRVHLLQMHIHVLHSRASRWYAPGKYYAIINLS